MALRQRTATLGDEHADVELVLEQRGGTLGGLLAKAGHEVMFSDRDMAQAKTAAAGAGANARTGSAKEAATFGEVVLIAVPYAALPAIAKEVGAEAIYAKIKAL